MSDQNAEMFTVAKFAGVSPLDVLSWPNPMYLDYVEYMELHAEIKDRAERREQNR